MKWILFTYLLGVNGVMHMQRQEMPSFAICEINRPIYAFYVEKTQNWKSHRHACTIETEV